MRYYLFILLIIASIASNAQQQIWKIYIDDEYKDEEYTQIHTHQNNRYILSSTESFSGSVFYNDHIISVTKTMLDGNILWTKTYRAGGEKYKQFNWSNVVFKDTLILFYGDCSDLFDNRLSFLFEIDINGVELFSKIYKNIDFIYHVNYSDSNTIDCVYEDKLTLKKVYSESFNKKHVTILKDSFYIFFNSSYYVVNNSNIYLTSLYKNSDNRIGIRIFKYNLEWNLLQSDSVITDVIEYPTNLPLYIYPQYKRTITNNILEISGFYNISSTEKDYYYFNIDLSNLTLVENLYFKKIPNANYTVNGTSVLYDEYNRSNYSLYKVYNKDSLIKYKYKLLKFQNSIPIWNVDLKIPNDSSINIISKSVSLDFINDKILATIRQRQFSGTYVQYITEYDTNGNYLRSFEDITDTGCSYAINIKTIYNTQNEILSLVYGKLKGRTDHDIIWKKTSFEPLGFKNNPKATILPPYPNPTNNILYLNCEVCENIRVYDIYSKLVLEKCNTNIIELAPLSQGIYFVELSENNTRQVFRVIKN